jgi:glutathione synthase
MSVESAPGGEPVEAGRQQQVAVLLAEMVEDATVWCVVHELVVGVRTDPIRTPPPPLSFPAA